METKVVKTNVITTATDPRLLTARGALDAVLKPRTAAALLHAVLYQNNARIYYLENGFHRKHAKIEIQKLIEHVLLNFSSSELSDITIYDFIEENLQKVCLSYLEAGKEIIAL